MKYLKLGRLLLEAT